TVAVRETQLLFDELTLQLAYAVVVERGVVVHVLGAVDEAVIGDDRGAGSVSLVQHRAQRGAIDSGNHQDGGTVGNLVLDLGDLLVRLVVGVLQVNGAAVLLQTFTQSFTVVDPALKASRGHRDANVAVLEVARTSTV